MFHSNATYLLWVPAIVNVVHSPSLISTRWCFGNKDWGKRHEIKKVSTRNSKGLGQRLNYFTEGQQGSFAHPLDSRLN